MIDRVRIELTQVFGFSVRVRERLKVDDELVSVESFSNVIDTFAHLVSNRIGFYGRRRPERVVVAIGASADGNGAVAIGTGESRIDDDFINSLAEFFLEPSIVGTESLGRA